MSTYTGTCIKDLDVTTPTEGAAGTIPEFNNCMRETKLIIKNNNAITTITGDTTLDATHSTVIINKATAIAVTLPTASTVASAAFIKEYYLKNIGAGVATINATVTLVGTATVSPTMAQWDEMRIWTDGTTWYGVKYSSTPTANTVPVRDANSALNSSICSYYNYNSSFVPSTTTYATITGLVTSTDAATQMLVPINGIIKNLAIKTPGNTLNVPLVVTLRKNGSDTALTATITAGSTSAFFDNTHAVSLTAGDLINWSIAIGSGTGIITYGLQISATLF